MGCDQVPRNVRSYGEGAIALAAPSSDDAQPRDLIQFDLGQATVSVMLAAADLGIGSAHAGVHDQELARHTSAANLTRPGQGLVVRTANIGL